MSIEIKKDLMLLLAQASHPENVCNEASYYMGSLLKCLDL